MSRNYKIQEVIKRRQILLVQVVKEERGNKGAALTTYLSLAGRYCVLMPNTSRGGGISRKISSLTDRKRLKKILAELEVPEGMGVIVRTAGSGRTKAEIKRDYEYLMRLWSNIRETTLSSIAPALVYEEANLIKRSIRDLYGRDIEEIVIQGEPEYRTAKEFMKLFIPSHAKRVKLHDDPERPLFHLFQVENQLDAMHLPSVPLQSGGYIVINPTEALVSIDVNSGRADPRAAHRGNGAAHQPGGGRRDRPPAAPARPGRADRHRLHRHGEQPQPGPGRAADQGRAEVRPGADPGRPDQPVRPAGAVAPAASAEPARDQLRAVPVLWWDGRVPDDRNRRSCRSCARSRMKG